MVVRRPKNPNESEPGVGQVPDAKKVELMEHLVRKSLAINPALKQGNTPTEAVEELRKQALDVVSARRATASLPPVKEALPPAADVSERRKSTIAFFFEQKAGELAHSLADVDARIRALQTERANVQRRTAGEIADFLSLMSGGAESPEARLAMRDHRELLKELGVSDTDIVQLAKRRS